MTTGKADSDLGGRGVYSYLECAVIPALLLGDQRFIDSGALRAYGELCLMHCDTTGFMPDTGQSDYTSYPTYTLRKVAALLGDPGFLATMPRREEAERLGSFSAITMEFTAGQAWATGLEPEPMDRMVGVHHLPLTDWEHEVRGGDVPLAKTFDKLTMREGFGRDDQYLQLVASLEATNDLPTFGFAHSRVDEYCFSTWDRRIFWRKGKWLAVFDRVVVDEEGEFSLECQWRTIGEPRIEGSNYTAAVWDRDTEDAPRDVLHIRNAEGLPLRYSEQTRGLFGPSETKRWERYCGRAVINRVRSRSLLPYRRSRSLSPAVFRRRREARGRQALNLGRHVRQSVLEGDPCALVVLAPARALSLSRPHQLSVCVPRSGPRPPVPGLGEPTQRDAARCRLPVRHGGA